MLQWQDGKQVAVWPKEVAKGQVEVPELHQGHVELNSTSIMLPGLPREHFHICIFPGSRGSGAAAAIINACIPNPDRRLCHQRAVCARRYRLHPDLRRFRRPQSLARRHHGAGGGRGMGGRQRAAYEHLCRRAGRRRGGAGRGVCHLFCGGAADPEIEADSQRGKGNLRPHRHLAVGDHDPGTDRLFLHQQRQDRAADRRRRGRHLRRPHAAQRNLHRGGLLPGDRPALAAGQPHPHRQGGAGGLDEPARRHAARAGTDQHLCRGMGDLRHPGRHRRRAARHVPRRQLL